MSPSCTHCILTDVLLLESFWVSFMEQEYPFGYTVCCWNSFGSSSCSRIYSWQGFLQDVKVFFSRLMDFSWYTFAVPLQPENTRDVLSRLNCQKERASTQEPRNMEHGLLQTVGFPIHWLQTSQGNQTGLLGQDRGWGEILKEKKKRSHFQAVQNKKIIGNFFTYVTLR